MNNGSISKNLRWLMRQSETSENELARQTGIPQPTINRILSEHIKSPRHQTIKPIADFFGITVDELCSRDIKNSVEIELRKPADSVLIPLLTDSDLEKWLNEGAAPPDRIKAYDVGAKAFAMRLSDVKSTKVTKNDTIIFDPDNAQSSTFLIIIDGNVAVRDAETELGELFFVGGFSPIPSCKVDFFIPAVAIAQTSLVRS